MEVHCESCPAKYAVPDDKVRGKKVRIKCKHCGSPIVVDGTSLGGSPSAAPKAKASSLPVPTAAQPVPQPARQAVAPSAAQPVRPAAATAPKPVAAPAAAAAKPAAASAPAPRPSAWREPAQASPAPIAPASSSAWREPAAIPARGIKSTMLGIPAPATASAPAPPPAPQPTPAPAAARVAKHTLLGGLDAPAATARAAVSAPRPAEPAPAPPRSVKRTMLGIPAPAGELPLKPEPARTAPTEPAPPPEPARGVAELEPSAEAEWTVAITDEQHEEMTTAQVIQAYAGGEIGDDTFIWAEGMDDWKNPFEIPLLAAELASRGYGPGSGAHDDDQTVITQAPSESVPPGVWREPGSWRGPALGDGGGDEPSDVSFDDVTVSMDSSKAQELLRAAGADDVPARGLGDTRIDDATHDDVTQAVDSRPFFAESAPIANRGYAAHAPIPREEDAPLDWDEDPTTAMEPPGSSDSRLTGARNEDSVLFSLDALAQSQHAPTPQKKPRADDDFLLARPEPAAPMPAPIALEAPASPPPVQPQMPAPQMPAPQMPQPYSAPAPQPQPQPQTPAAPRSFPPSAVAAIASAPIPPQSVAPRRGSRAWLWILLLLILAGGALAASYYFKQPARVWEVLGPLIHPQSAAPALPATAPAPPQPSAAPAPAPTPPAPASASAAPAQADASAPQRAP